MSRYRQSWKNQLILNQQNPEYLRPHYLMALRSRMSMMKNLTLTQADYKEKLMMTATSFLETGALKNKQ